MICKWVSEVTAGLIGENSSKLDNQACHTAVAGSIRAFESQFKTLTLLLIWLVATTDVICLVQKSYHKNVTHDFC